MTTRQPGLDAGARFGPYHLIRLLGEGGFAQVWEAENLDTGRRLALKILTELKAESSTALERFQLEGRLAASLSHPRCVYVFAAEEIDGYPVISMELMRGGTLADRLSGGPVPVERAVNYVLDVLAGLEAAQQAGIIHRDIKPSNCFLDEAGGAKIGDFGISKSLGVDSGLSVTGSFLGTPYYASPEQVGGEPVDFRSDLYSVGAMLYELLTGKPPFAGTNPGQVIAQVLTKDPTPFSQHAVRVPRGVQRIVLRLLAKPKEKRYQSYQALRAALLPFSSRGLSPAALARRFGAIAVDFGVFAPIGAIVGLNSLVLGPSAQVLGTIAVLSVQLVYFVLMEGLLGWTIGKRIFGLRVVTDAGESPTVGRALKRGAVFEFVYFLPGLIVLVLIVAETHYATTPAFQTLASLTYLLSAGALCCTMRKTNGYAGLHELASGTRVVEVQHEVRVADMPRVAAPAPTMRGDSMERYGPYRSLGLLWRRGDEALVVARDDELGRDVWIHVWSATTAVPPIERLLDRAPGAMPWLQRSRHERGQWDAYGAPNGIAFTQWVRDRGRLSWHDMRGVLDSFAHELAARFAAAGTAGPLSLAHIWVDTSGSIALLDFPFEAAGEGELDAVQEVTPRNWLEFTRRFVTTGFEGDTAGRSRLPPEPPRVPMPDHARELLARLYSDEAAFQSADELAGAIDRVRARPTAVTRLRRVGPFGVHALFFAFPAFALLVMPLILSRAPAWFNDLGMMLPVYVTHLPRVEPDSGGIPTDSMALRTARSIRIVLSWAYSEARRAPQMADAVLNQMPKEGRAVVEKAATMYPSPSAAEVADARRWLAPRVQSPMSGMRGRAPEMLFTTFVVFGYVGVPAVLLAIILRGNVLLHMFGIGVQKEDGAPAGRWRCGLRALLAWSPLLALAFYALNLPTPVAPARRDAIQVGLIAIALAGVGWSLLRPSRGPADRLARTVLMPK